MQSRLAGCFVVYALGLHAFVWAQTEVWTNFGGRFNPSGGWFDWVQNDVDGRYCAEAYSGHIQCWDAVTNTIERVYTYTDDADVRVTHPRRGDLQTWFWDHIYQEYIHVDGCRSGRGVFAFHYSSRQWRPLTDSDFSGLSGRTPVCGNGSAVSVDHDMAVIVGGRGGIAAGRQTRIFDLQARRYFEFNAPTAMIPRIYTQQQLVYVATLHKFLLFGGRSGGNNLNDLWLFDPATLRWEQVAHQNPPSPRYFGQMAYDIVTNRVYLTGGHGGDGRVSYLALDTWTWEHLPLPPGQPRVDYPGWRRVGAAISDPLRGFCHTAGVLVGGTWIDAAKIWCGLFQ